MQIERKSSLTDMKSFYHRWLVKNGQGDEIADKFFL